MHDTFACARTRPSLKASQALVYKIASLARALGLKSAARPSVRATIEYLVYTPSAYATIGYIV